MKRIEREKSNYNRVIKYTSLFGGIQVITLLASVLRNKLVAVILGPSGLGLISVYNSVMKLLNDSTNLGISFSAVRNVSEIYAEENPQKLENYIRTVRSWSILTALFGVFVGITLAPVLSFWTFENYEYTWAIVLLSPAIGLMAISGGELAILKGLRKLRQVAFTSLAGAIATLVISIPLYFVWGMQGIIPSLLLTTFATTAIILYHSFRIAPFRLSKSYGNDLKEGKGMIKLGVPFILAGILGSGVEYIIRAFLLRESSLDMVGFYNAGYSITITYAGMVLAAMETDYFPRLSAVNKNRKQYTQVTNQQIEIAILLITPLLVIFLVFLPYILQLLYSSKFLPVVGMTEFATLGMFFRAITLPIAYLTLAKGDSIVYFILELLYDICIVLLVIFLFGKYGLSGAGLALTLAAIFDLVIVYSCAYFKYKFRLSKQVLSLIAIQIPWILLAFMLTFTENSLLAWSGGILCLIVSSVLSLYLLNKKTTLLQKFKQKFNQ